MQCIAYKSRGTTPEPFPARVDVFAVLGELLSLDHLIQNRWSGAAVFPFPAAVQRPVITKKVI